MQVQIPLAHAVLGFLMNTFYYVPTNAEAYVC